MVVKPRGRVSKSLLVLGLLVVGCGGPKGMAAVLDDSSGSGDSGAPDLPDGRFSEFQTCEVTSPPPELALDSLYARYLNCSGIAVVATAGVDDQALIVADETMAFMLRGNDDIADNLIAGGAYVILLGEDLTIPELPESFPGSTDQSPGYTSGNISVSYGNDLLCKVGERPFDNNIFLHEFVHMINFAGFSSRASVEPEIEGAYAAALTAGLWRNTYAGSNHTEYFAELVQKWFEVGRPQGPEEGDGTGNHIITREQLEAYDPRGVELVRSYFNTGFDVPGCVRRNVFEPYVDPDFSCPTTVVDGDGNDYAVARIGDQCWMAGNLAATRFADGTEIIEVADEAQWVASSGPSRSAYDNDPSNVAAGGWLYNHAAVVSTAGLCPEDMRVPTVADIERLERWLELGLGERVAASLRARGEWASEATDDFGFGARPTGSRVDPGFEGLGTRWSIWTSGEQPGDSALGLSYRIAEDAEDLRGGATPKYYGLSVRCMSD